MDMKIYRVGSRPSVKGPEEFFTGTARIDPLFNPTEPVRAARICIGPHGLRREPGARTAWHTHPLGQHLIVTAGCGWTQCWDGPKKEIRAGDVVFCNCGKKHWHGATDTTGMSHIAIQEYLDGTVINWLEKVSDEQYMAAVEPD